MTILEAGLRAVRRRLARLPWNAAAARDEADGRNGPRIAVIGNCQARGVARSLTVLLPNARVSLHPTPRAGGGRLALRAFADGLEAYDHVFLQPLAVGGAEQDLPGLLPRARLFPAIVFPAFHPDMIYVGDLGTGGGSALVPSPLHTYHSAIALFGHLRGLSPERIAGLFREEVFAFLGYLDVWPPAAEDLSASSRAIGFDLGPDLTRWARRGAFMHGINHPRLFVLADIAARLAREAGLDPVALPVEGYLVDDLLDDVIWPVYPPVAEIYGLNGSYLFKRRTLPGAAPEVLDLDGFVAESLALYKSLPAGRLTCHRIAHWHGVPEIRALFDRA